MKDKKYTQLQRIKVLEEVLSKVWNILKLQGEEITKLKENDKKNRQENESIQESKD